MQFTKDSHQAVADGTITITFRLWKQPHARVGGRYAVGGVLIEVDDIEMIPFSAITNADIRRAGAKDRESLRARAAHAGPILDETLLYRITFHLVGEKPDPVRTPTDAGHVAAVIAKLDRMDARSERGAWTRTVLSLIRDHPGTVSTTLASNVGRPRSDFKADVRKLKALGLTESLEVGYCLTPLGNKVLRDSNST